MSRNHTSRPSPNAPSSDVTDSRRLDSAFEGMFLDASDVSGGDFNDDWGVADIEEALALSFVDDARLKDCIAAASASVWGVPLMRPAQLEACYRLLHPHHPNSLVVVHRTGGGKLFLEFLMQSGQLPQAIDPKVHVSAILASNTFWKETLFDRAAGGISRMHVDSLFLSLIAAGMIKMTMQNNALQWVIAREYDPLGTSIIESRLGRPLFKRDNVWDGIHLFSENRMRRRKTNL